MINASEMGKKGSKKRWKGTTKKQRTAELRRVAIAGWITRKAFGKVK